MNKHTIWHNIRTISTGLLILGLAPIPFLFMGSSASNNVSMYFTYILVCVIVIILSQVMVTKYKGFIDSSNSKKQNEKLYSYIGIGIILLFFAGFMLMPVLGRVFN